MSRVILHIGTHKTATTFVQNSFAANRDLLARHGVIYPEIGRTAGHHSLVTHWHDLPAQFRTDAPPLELWQGLARFAKGDRTAFLSSEEFSRGDRRVDFTELRDLLAAFERIEVVCCLRDQPSFLQSIYLQVARNHKTPDFPVLLGAAIRTGQASGLFMDYGKLLDFLLESFPPEALRFVDYAGARRAGGGILGTMLDICGAGGALASFAPNSMAAANVSPDPLAFWIARKQAGDQPVTPARLARAKAALCARFGAGCRTTLFTRDEYRHLADHVAPLNAAFSARVCQIQPLFTLTPPDPLAETTIWREDIDATVWNSLAAGADPK